MPLRRFEVDFGMPDAAGRPELGRDTRTTVSTPMFGGPECERWYRRHHRSVVLQGALMRQLEAILPFII